MSVTAHSLFSNIYFDDMDKIKTVELIPYIQLNADNSYPNNAELKAISDRWLQMQLGDPTESIYNTSIYKYRWGTISTSPENAKWPYQPGSIVIQYEQKD